MRGLLTQLHYFVYTLLAIPRAVAFIREQRLWEGLRQYKWVRRFVIGVAIVAGLYLIQEFIESVGRSTQVGIAQGFFSSDGFLGRVGHNAYDSLTDGGVKWVILILLEVVIYHFMRQSLKVIAGKEVEQAHLFKPFVEAQKRMIAVSFCAYGLEIFLTEVCTSVISGILPFLSFLEAPFVLFVQCTLIGFAIVDNYHEQFGLKIGQSLRYARQRYLGICLAVGVPLFFVLKIPFFGALVGPLVASVTVALAMYELSDLDTVGYQPTEKEKKKAAKKAAKAERKAERKAQQKAAKEAAGLV